MATLTSFHNLNTVVTGASSGIGRELALRLADEGARVALIARRVERLRELAEQIRQRGREAFVVPCDVAVREEVGRAAQLVLEHFGGVDLLVNNAGYAGRRPFVEWDVEDIEHIMRVNYFGAVYWTKELLPHMVERGRGWLVFMASAAGKTGVPDESAYAATKFAVVGLAESVSLEVEDAGVHTLIVCPGVVHTELFDRAGFEALPAAARRMARSPEHLVDQIVRALRRGRHELLYPRPIALAQAVRGVAPRFYRHMVRRITR